MRLNKLKLVLFTLVMIFGSIQGFSQYHLTGKIVTKKDKPLVGATVMINNTRTGTITDINGEFSLNYNLDEGSQELIIEIHKYKKSVVPFEGGKNLNFGDVKMKKGRRGKYSPEVNIIEIEE